jgi:hypothetical protein
MRSTTDADVLSHVLCVIYGDRRRSAIPGTLSFLRLPGNSCFFGHRASTRSLAKPNRYKLTFLLRALPRLPSSAFSRTKGWQDPGALFAGAAMPSSNLPPKVEYPAAAHDPGYSVPLGRTKSPALAARIHPTRPAPRKIPANWSVRAAAGSVPAIHSNGCKNDRNNNPHPQGRSPRSANTPLGCTKVSYPWKLCPPWPGKSLQRRLLPTRFTTSQSAAISLK